MEEKLIIPVKSPDECGAYPFGVCIPAQKIRTFEVYKPLLMRWITEREVYKPLLIRWITERSEGGKK